MCKILHFWVCYRNNKCDMTNLIKIKKGTVKSWPSKLKASLIARGEGNPYEEVVTKT